MPFLVRKLMKRDEISALSDAAEVSKVYADIPTTEFRTKNGTLSTWIIDSLDDLGNAVLAIAVTSSEISKMDFIAIDTQLLSDNALEFQQTYAGQDIAIPDLQDTHYDILNITVEKLVDCMKVYQSIVKTDPDGEKYIIRYAAGEIKDLLKKALLNHSIDETKASEKLKKELSKLKEQ